MGNIYTVGPNEALVVSGGCFGQRNKRTIVGGWAWAWSCVTDVQSISLEVMTLNPRCDKVETAKGVAVTVTGVAQVKIIKEDELLKTACEQFLGKQPRDIENILLQTLEGHLRAILGTLTVEEIYKDRDTFATLVREVASPDVGRMGIEILSFTIKDIVDDVNYLNSLGKTQTANVKKEADIGVAEANKNAGIREAESDRLRQNARYKADTSIADSSREYQMQKASFDQEVNAKNAEAELAYQLQAAKEKQRIRNEEIQIEVIERRKLIEVEEKEIERKETELQSTVKSPAEAESYRVQARAEAEKTKKVYAAQAEAERIKMIGAAEAAAMEAIGKAEAERMRQKAAAYKQYGNAALMSLILEAMPKIAAEIAAPLGKTEEILIINDDEGGSKVGSELTKLIGQLPPTIQALTGVDLSKAFSKIPGAQVVC
ncbi:flotillin-2 isoform X1 [Hydra vulgaris]|uniref:Flotillin-2 n=1 Tax=Hydra vulgaris TaxID=6087 RepID=T2MDG4_HYDVU|nr:flotillin-2 isoform X1 [Hydra vulgaris]XP_047141603.1 flotillin-2 isoform X2 [Hydra vulgaris]